MAATGRPLNQYCSAPLSASAGVGRPLNQYFMSPDMLSPVVHVDPPGRAVAVHYELERAVVGRAGAGGAELIPSASASGVCCENHVAVLTERWVGTLDETRLIARVGRTVARRRLSHVHRYRDGVAVSDVLQEPLTLWSRFKLVRRIIRRHAHGGRSGIEESTVGL